MFQRYFDEGDQCYKYDPNSSTNRWCYTFCMWDFYDNQPHDLSVDQFKYRCDESCKFIHTKNNIIKSNFDVGMATNKHIIVNIAFVTNTNISQISSDYLNGTFYGFYNNEISGECENVSFNGSEFHDNILLNIRYSTIVDAVLSNINGIRNKQLKDVFSKF